MDRALIERMVGATVLVLLLVIVAPALLDGSRPEPASQEDSESGDRMRTEVILLTESAERSARRESSDQVASVDPPSRQPEALPAPAPASQSRPEPVAAPEPTSSAAPARQVSAAPEAAGGYAVQLGSFREQDNASQFADKIKRQGFPVFVQSAGSSAGRVYRVYAGPRPTRDAAEKLTATLGKAGYDGMVIDMSAN